MNSFKTPMRTIITFIGIGVATSLLLLIATTFIAGSKIGTATLGPRNLYLWKSVHASSEGVSRVSLEAGWGLAILWGILFAAAAWRVKRGHRRTDWVEAN
jgi:hypothetical protein